MQAHTHMAMSTNKEDIENKPNWATIRPDCVTARSEIHAAVETDEQKDITVKGASQNTCIDRLVLFDSQWTKQNR